MLVLTRRIGETIVIQTKDGTKVSFVIASTNRGQVKVAFEAPNSTKIYRQEIFDKIQSNKRNIKIAQSKDEKKVVNG